jgi:hypothetical protein
MKNINHEVNSFYSAPEVVRVFLLFVFGLLPFVCVRPGMLEIPLVTASYIKLAYTDAG